MPGKDKSQREFEVRNSFDGLEKHERFTGPLDDWAKARIEAGYLADVTDESTAGQGQGSVAPEATPERVQGARNAGEDGQG